MATILVVDDLSANRAFLVTLLNYQGHRLLEAPDGRTGLAVARAERPDLIITDVLMPVMDGYELVRQLRLDDTTRHVPVLFYTAHYGEREARTLALSSGVSYVLTKPVEPQEVLRVVGLALAGRSEDKASRPDAAALPSDFDQEHLRLLTDKLSANVEELRTANARLRALVNIGLELASERDSDRLLSNVCVASRDLFGASHVTLGLIDRQHHTVQRVVTCGAPVRNAIDTRAPLSALIAAVVAGRHVTRGDHPDRLTRSQLPAIEPEAEAYLAAPIVSPTSVYGWMALLSNEGRIFTEDDEQLLMALCGQVGRIYENGDFYRIAERRAVELEQQIVERTKTEDILSKTSRLVRNLIEHLPHRILIKDTRSVTIFCNANYAKDVGLTPEEVIGRDTFAFHPPELAQAYVDDDQEVIASGQIKDIEERYQVGTEDRWVHTLKIPYRDEEGRVTGVIVIFEDVTERRMLETQYQQAQKMEAIGRLAGGIAHDFNNLLTAILGYCELLLADFPPADPRARDIEGIQAAGRSAAGLTRQLLAFSRKEIIELTRLDLNVVVASLRGMLRRLIGEDVKVVLSLRPEPALVEADHGQVEQVIMNLALNARDAMPRGGSLTIETANVELQEEYTRTHILVKPGPYVALTVSDTGTGIPPEIRGRLFEPFFTTKEPGKGTGLGLATVHGIVARGGGSVNVYSEVGKGTSVTVYFPRVVGGGREAVASAPVAPRGGTQTILVVEDEEALRNLVTRLLQRLGYTALVAENADEARRLFEEHPTIEILLTDVVMPGSSGPALAAQLMGKRPDLKVIYMSGYTEEAIVQHGVLNPGIAFINKPFTSETLDAKIREVLDG